MCLCDVCIKCQRSANMERLSSVDASKSERNRVYRKNTYIHISKNIPSEYQSKNVPTSQLEITPKTVAHTHIY